MICGEAPEASRPDEMAATHLPVALVNVVSCDYKYFV